VHPGGGSRPLDNDYDVLGVSRDSSEEEIRLAYRELVRRYHPDACPSRIAAKLLARINTAYERLRKSSKSRDSESRQGRQQNGVDLLIDPCAGRIFRPAPEALVRTDERVVCYAIAPVGSLVRIVLLEPSSGYPLRCRAEASDGDSIIRGYQELLLYAKSPSPNDVLRYRAIVQDDSYIPHSVTGEVRCSDPHGLLEAMIEDCFTDSALLSALPPCDARERSG
jgi:curved DNA-binding protein CbpA